MTTWLATPDGYLQHALVLDEPSPRLVCNLHVDLSLLVTRTHLPRCTTCEQGEL